MPEQIKGFKLFLLSLAIGLGTLLISLDTFIANVSIPTIAGDLGVSQDNGSWVITSFTVANAIIVPLTGWLTTLFGRVRLFCVSTILFSIFSFFCGFSASLPMLIVFRFLQGLSSGCLIPLSQSLLITIYPDDKKGFALGLWGLVAMVGPVMGPFLGGWITDNYNWGWIFYINVPLGILASITTYVLLHMHESERKKPPMDTVGLFLFVVGIASLQIMLDRGNDLDWWGSPFIIVLTILCIVCLSFFVIWEIFQKDPVIDISLFKDWNFTLGTLFASFSVMMIFASLILEPLWVQNVLGYTPLWSGLTLAPFGVFAVVVFPLLGLYLNVVDVRIWLAISFIIFAASFFWMSNLYFQVPYWAIAMPRLFQGLAFALLFLPLASISISKIPKEKIPSATGVFAFMRMLFIGIGVSLSVTYWTRRAQFYQSRFTELVIPSNPEYAPYVQKLAQLNIVGEDAEVFIYQNIVVNQSFTSSILDLYYFAGWVFIILFAGLGLFRIDKKQEDETEMIAKVPVTD